MNHIGVGISHHGEPSAAVREAAGQAMESGGLVQAEWLLAFFTPQHIAHADQIYNLLKEQTGCSSIAGCSGLGVLTASREIFNDPGLVVMAGSTPGLRTLTLSKYQELPDSPGVNQQLKETLEEFGGEEPLFFFFPDVYQHQPYNFINTFNYVRTRPRVYGAGSCDDGSRNISVQFGNEGVVINGVSGLSFSGIPRVQTGVTQSCRTIGDPMFVTGVENDTILMLDGVPALEVFRRVATELELSDIHAAAQQLLICFPLDSEEPRFDGESSVARHLTGVDTTRQGIIVSQQVHEGSVVSFAYRSAMCARDDLSAMLSRMKEEIQDRPSFGVYFNCAARGEALYGKPDVDTGIIREELGHFPLIGFFGGYELAAVRKGLQFYTYTGVLVLIYLE